MLQRSLENQEAAAREEQNKLVSLKKKNPKRNTARDFPFTPQDMLLWACSQQNAMVWFVFCFVFTCRMSKMSCRCVLTAVLCVIMLTFREQNNNVKQTLAYRDTRSNLAFIYVSGRGGEKKKHNLKVLLREKLCVNRTSHRSILRNASWSYVTHTKRGLFWLPVSLLTYAACSLAQAIKLNKTTFKWIYKTAGKKVVQLLCAHSCFPSSVLTSCRFKSTICLLRHGGDKLETHM